VIVGFCTKCRYCGLVRVPEYRHVRPGTGEECGYSAIPVPDDHDQAGPDLEQAEERMAREFMEALSRTEDRDIGGEG